MAIAHFELQPGAQDGRFHWRPSRLLLTPANTLEVRVPTFADNAVAGAPHQQRIAPLTQVDPIVSRMTRLIHLPDMEDRIG